MENTVSKETVLEFISNFQNEGTIKTFTEGCCYWFAFILLSRFHTRNTKIVYNEVSGHFGTTIDGTIYDITGEIKDPDDKWILFDDYRLKEPTYTQVLIRDCILKTNGK